jgi:hypothetical protein
MGTLIAILFPIYMYVLVWMHGYGTGNTVTAIIITGVLFLIITTKMSKISFEIINTYFKQYSFYKKKRNDAITQIRNLYSQSHYESQLHFIYTLFLIAMVAESLLFAIFIDTFCFTFLISCAVLLLGYFYISNNTSNCITQYFELKLGNDWETFVCPHCSALGCDYKGYQNYQKGDYRLKQTNSTDRHEAYVDGQTIYYTTTSTNFALQRDYSYTAVYYCNVCKKYYTRQVNGTKNLS